MKNRSFLYTTLAAALALMFVPVAANAEYLVPEGNSAVNQYTEGVPSAGGDKATRNGEISAPVKPGRTIGAANAKKLREQGPEGQAVAEVAAETAPEPTVTESSETAERKAVGANRNTHGHRGAGKRDKRHGHKHRQGSSKSGAAPAAAEGDGPGGSSGIGSTLAAATGTEGQLSVLLPLIILAAAVSGAVYAFRQRKQSAPQQ
jgi:hypothetical protein